jgi:hypothetical protein
MSSGGWVRQQPDNRFTNELCAIANTTMNMGTPGMEWYGWDDIQCGRKIPFMCRIIREWRAVHRVPIAHWCLG